MKKIEIAILKKTLEKAGIKDVKLEQKDNGVHWLSIKRGFQISEEKNGTIVNINGMEILINNFHPLFPPRENSAQKSLFLKPNTD